MSISCASAINGTDLFSSTDFIAPHQNDSSKEGSHALMQRACYRSYMLDGPIIQPLFGLGVEHTIALGERVLGGMKATDKVPVCHIPMS